MTNDELRLSQYIDRECCDVATHGRRSGRRHVVELWFGVIDETIYFISGNGRSADWFANIVAHPEVEVRFDSDHRRRRHQFVAQGLVLRLTGSRN